METDKKSPREKRAVVLLSGGMDSAVTAAIARQNYQLAMLHISYGQRCEKRELRAFQEISDFYCSKNRMVTQINHLKQIGHSSLTDEHIGIETANLKRKGIPLSYVPFRNAHFLSLAVSWGEVIGAHNIFIGAVEEDSSGYPDCCESYYDAWQKVIELGTKPETHLKIVTPLIHMRKAEIVRRGLELGAPLHLSWSCYQGQEIACGTCDSCALRLRGFQEAGKEDPISYRERPSYYQLKSDVL